MKYQATLVCGAKVGECNEWFRNLSGQMNGVSRLQA